ncbi:hypothetical protein B0H19DRAFT_1288618 [Mycena capillaripes]|nr:hypothetical protein B0H19DRAFT_1288618 [Mycena capillaripes]
MFPEFLKPIVERLISPKQSCMRLALKTLEPIIEKRLATEAELGSDWPDKPDDYIQWLLDDAEASQRTPYNIALRILATDCRYSYLAITTALFDLTAHPENIESMREETERVAKEEGWIKSALNNIHKIGSFLRESQRVHGTPPSASTKHISYILLGDISCTTSMTRKVIVPAGFTFPTGLHYDNPHVFDGFRFAREREEHADKGGVAAPHGLYGPGQPRIWAREARVARTVLCGG